MIAPDINTARLSLRSLKQEDSAEIVTIWADREGGKYLSDAYYKNADELAALLDDIPQSPVYYFAASFIGTKEIIATCSIAPEKDNPDSWGIGYAVAKEYWGNGYAVEMIKALIEFAKSFNIRTIISNVAQENKASNRVMEKCGFYIAGKSSYKKCGTKIVYPSYIYKLQSD